MNAATIVLVLGLALAPVWAQPEGPPPMGPPGGPGDLGPPRPPVFLERLFPPSLVMQNQAAIGLTDDQRKAIIDGMADAEKQLLDVRWKLEAESEKLTKLVDADPLDERAALAQAGRVLELESQLKRTHLGLLLRIKNQLTAVQREKLRELRPARPRAPAGPLRRP